MRDWSLGRASAAVTSVLLLATALGACGSSSSNVGAPSAATGAKGADRAARAFVAHYMQPANRRLPTSAPRPTPGKRIWILSCSQAAEGCAIPARGAAEAARLIGWKPTIFDGKGDPGRYASGVRNAVAASADGIVLVAIDCAAAKAPLAEARRAGVKIFGYLGVDCDDRFGGGGAKEFDGELDIAPPLGDFGAGLEDVYGRLMADYAIVRTAGKADVLAITEDDNAAARHIYTGYLRWLGRDCASCNVHRLPIAFADLLEGRLQQKVQAALTRYPTVNAVIAPYDALVVGGVAPAVKAAGRKILVVGGEGQSANIAMIRKGQGQDLAVGAPSRWAGWASVDALNRLFHGAPLVDEGIGQAVIDHGHNLPSATPYYDGGGAPYAANFKRIWSVGP